MFCTDKELAVVIPTYNRPELTIRAINSVTTKRPSLVEIVVADDCSEPPFEFQGNTNVHGVSVRVIRGPANGGPGHARRIAIDHSRARTIAFLDSDDVYAPGWCDEVLRQIDTVPLDQKCGLFLAGSVQGGSIFHLCWFHIARKIPSPVRPLWTRLTAVFFNPFYTPSVAASREICHSSKTLRFCEDYYTNALALFRAKRIVLSPAVACSLSRRPGATGGESGLASRMFEGEITVRKAILRSEYVPFFYKVLVPLGVLYQLIRSSLKSASQLLATIASSSQPPR